MFDPKSNVDDFKKCSQDTLLSAIMEINYTKGRFCFILGSGASRESGIKTGQEMQKEWLQKIKEDAEKGKKDAKSYIEDRIRQINKKNKYNKISLDVDCLLSKNYSYPSKNYFPLFKLRFFSTEKNGYSYLEKELENASHSFGYYPLARILTETPNNVAISLNFDSLVEDSIFMYTKNKPLVLAHESLVACIDVIRPRPIIIKINRSLYFDPFNSPESTNVLRDEWKERLKEIFKVYTPIFIGYGGGEASLMTLLKEETTQFRNGLFWCYMNESAITDDITEIIKRHDGYGVQIAGFDDFMYHFGEAMGYNETMLDDVSQTLANTAEIRIKQFKNSFYQFNAKYNDIDSLAEREKTTSTLLPQKKHLTLTPSKVNENQFVHRDIQMVELKAKIASDENFVHISGLAGIGKTAIARALYHELEQYYAHVAWIDYKGNLKQDILNQFNLYTDEKNQNIRWNQIKFFLTEYEDKFLIFVDNITQEDSDLDLLTSLNAHVVITSRLSKVLNFEAYEIGPLTREQSMDLFYRYSAYDKKQEETVFQLVNLVRSHALSIELLAGISNSSKYRFDLKKFLKDLQDNRFQFPKKIYTSHTYEELTISEHLSKLFEISSLSNEQLRILGNFQIIPKGLPVYYEFPYWMACEYNALEELITTGWISFSENGYVMHDIVWEAVKLQLTNIPYEYAEKIIDTMLSGNYFNDKDEYGLLTKKIEIVKIYLSYFSDREESEEWISLSNLLGITYYNRGLYPEAKKYYCKEVGIREKLLGKNHLDNAITYGKIALVCQAMGEFDNAVEAYEKILGIKEKLLGKNNGDTARAYKDIASLYSNKGDSKKALEYGEKALISMEKVYGDGNPNYNLVRNFLISLQNTIKDSGDD